MPKLPFVCAPLALAMCGALAQPSEILQCRALTDAAARLACYDALPLPPAAAPAPVAPAKAQAAPVAEPAAPVKPAEFGLENRARPGQVEEITSRIPGTFAGWGPKQRFRLENGQLWQVVDGSRGSYNLTAPVAHIRRAMLGSFLMEIEGVSQLIRVRRVE